MIKINIGIITYNRNKGLLKLLKSLDNLEVDNTFSIENVVIVDNSPDFNTQAINDQINQSKYTIVLENEKQPGIPFARNKVVELSKNVDFVAFIDDDEIADRNWLIELVKTQEKYNCAVVQGPVIPRYEHTPKKWHIYSRKQRKTGDNLFSMATNNTLISVNALNQFKMPFNTKLAQTGGTDSLLGRELIQKGHSVVWCNEAVVYEYIPKSRTTTKWVIQRSFRGGNNYSVQLKILNKNMLILIKRALICILHILTGIISFPLLLLPVKKRLYPTKKMFEGLGGLIGLFNFKYEEYKR